MKELGYTEDKKEKVDFEKCIVKDGITSRIRIEKVENGYIITLDKYGDYEGKYINECKKYISKTNPLKKESTDQPVTLKEFLAE